MFNISFCWYGYILNAIIIYWYMICRVASLKPGKSYYYLSNNDKTLMDLNHCGLVTPYGDTNLGQILFR